METLAELAKENGFPRISAYIPTHKVYPDAEQDPIRLSNALKEAERQLADAGVRRIDDLLASARQRTQEPVFWRYQDHGLAVFIDGEHTRWLKLPADVPEMIVVAERYHVLPLIDIFADRGRFHLLAATRNVVRFFDGAERDLEEVDVVDMPSGISEIMERTDLDDDVGYHTRGSGGGTGAPAMPKYHALGHSPEDYDEVELERFAQAIATAVDRHLAERVAPLVLAGQSRLLGRLRMELRYRQVADTDIQRNPEPMKDDELHAAAWAIAAPLLRQDRDEVRARFRARVEGADIPGSEDLQELLRATDEGRVATVLVSRDETVWGRYDETSRTVHLAEQAGPDNEDLLNLVAVKTMAQGGSVISLPEDLSHLTGPAAGLFRY